MADIPRGRFVWYELMTSDTEAAQRFYAQVMDWGAEPWKESDTPYTVLLNGQRPFGGLLAMPEDVAAQDIPPHWLAYISTPDADATLARATELGARVVFGPVDVPTVGRIAVLLDPQGVAFAIYTPAEHTPGIEGPPVPGDMSWHELATTDINAAFDFYRDLFGWEQTGEFDMGEMGPYRMYGQNGVPYGGMYLKPASLPAPPHWLLYTKVSDLDATLDFVRANGGQVLNGPEEVPGGDRVAQCMDPQGAAFALHSSGSAA